MTTRNDWFNDVTNSASPDDISRLTGIPRATLYRRLADMSFTAEEVIMIARTYRADPVSGLVAFGYLSPREANEEESESEQIKSFDLDAILNEIRRRASRRD